MDEDAILSIFESFDRGYTIGSELSHDAFRNKCNDTIEDSDFKEIDQIIRENGIQLRRDTFFPYDKLISIKEIEVIMSYIENAISNRCTQLSLLRLYDDLYDSVFINTKIDRDSANVIGAIIKCYYPDKYIIEENQIIFENASDDTVIELLLNSGQPLTLKEIQNNVLGLDNHQIESVISNKNRKKEIISLSRDRYWHIDCFHIDGELSSRLDKLLAEIFEIRESINLESIYNELEDQLGQKGILNSEYEIEDSKCLGNIILSLYSEYSIRSGNLVKHKSGDLSITIIKELENYEKFTSEQYDILMKKYGFQQWLYLDDILELFIRVDEKTFVKKEYVSFNCEEIDAALNSIIISDYCPLKRITTFAGFPPLEYHWNSYLLCSFIINYSNQFDIWFATKRTPKNFNGVIVRKGSFSSFDRICIDAVANSTLDLESVSEEQIGTYLKNEGFLSRVRDDTMKTILEEAKIKRRNHHV